MSPADPVSVSAVYLCLAHIHVYSREHIFRPKALRIHRHRKRYHSRYSSTSHPLFTQQKLLKAPEFYDDTWTQAAL